MTGHTHRPCVVPGYSLSAVLAEVRRVLSPPQSLPLWGRVRRLGPRRRSPPPEGQGHTKPPPRHSVPRPGLPGEWVLVGRRELPTGVLGHHVVEDVDVLLYRRRRAQPPTDVWEPPVSVVPVQRVEVTVTVPSRHRAVSDLVSGDTRCERRSLRVYGPLLRVSGRTGRGSESWLNSSQ